MNKELGHKFRNKLIELRDHAEKAITEVSKEKTFNEGLCCHLAEMIDEIDHTIDEIKKTHPDEDLAVDAELIQNLIHEPIRSQSSPHEKISLYSAAKRQLESKDTSHIKEVILACALDEAQTEVMLHNIEQICNSVDDQLSEDHVVNG
ncbi:MAG: hypothetical protein K9M07_01610 [Simkaniaceae bacterium]|nr:hypothetical protein [Simkaniaceae bacterium]MCF7851919.1 hypothetical protein [Simkaniaceae bacterium]